MHHARTHTHTHTLSLTHTHTHTASIQASMRGQKRIASLTLATAALLSPYTLSLLPPVCILLRRSHDKHPIAASLFEVAGLLKTPLAGAFVTLHCVDSTLLRRCHHKHPIAASLVEDAVYVHNGYRQSECQNHSTECACMHADGLSDAQRTPARASTLTICCACIHAAEIHPNKRTHHTHTHSWGNGWYCCWARAA